MASSTRCLILLKVSWRAQSTVAWNGPSSDLWWLLYTSGMASLLKKLGLPELMAWTKLYLEPSCWSAVLLPPTASFNLTLSELAGTRL